MDIRLMGLENPIFHTLHHMMDLAADESDKSNNVPSRNYVRDAKAMAATPADIKEYQNSYVFIIDMPDGVLTVTLEKLPPPEPKKPKTIEVKIA
ncbi:hypothetical protein K7X08_027453 [Anisodus acutangulus]|uniref:SHSP domain-containing protein n=1 Tax=Anisodus acutangulus TaxID=402998 RepID=A0A9Q1MJ83_9SOLA|nr:hypothetical protein K7X08_027453 [Anisodus acutangulus]